jgi:hypothetical protein
MYGFFALSLLSIAALAASKYTVTATIYDQDANNNSFTLQSDGSGSAMYSSGSGGVDSELTPNSGSLATNYNQWYLSLTNTSRSFNLTLTPVNGSGPGPFSGTLSFNGQVFSRCFGANTSTTQNWTQIQFSDANCGMRVSFTYQGVLYNLVMSPEFSGTGTATVTCNNWNGKSCSAWTDAPTASIANANVADLFQGVINSSAIPIGQYYLSFKVVLTHP